MARGQHKLQGSCTPPPPVPDLASAKALPGENHFTCVLTYRYMGLLGIAPRVLPPAPLLCCTKTMYGATTACRPNHPLLNGAAKSQVRYDLSEEEDTFPCRTQHLGGVWIHPSVRFFALGRAVWRKIGDVEEAVHMGVGRQGRNSSEENEKNGPPPPMNGHILRHKVLYSHPMDEKGKHAFSWVRGPGQTPVFT